MECEQTKGERIAGILKSACAVLYIVLAMLQIVGILGKGAVYARRLLWSAAALLQAYQLWMNKQRGLAVFFFVFAVFFLFPVVLFFIMRSD